MVVQNLKLGIGKEIDGAFEKHMQCDSADYRTNCIVNAIPASQTKMEELIKEMGSANILSVGPSNDENNSDDGPTMACIVEEDDCIDDDVAEDGEGTGTCRKRKNRENGMKALKKRCLTLRCHNNGLKVVPVHWKFPKMTFEQLCFSWKVVNKTENVPPFSLLMRHDVSHLKGGASKLWMMKLIMGVVCKIGLEKGCWHDGKSWSVLQVQSMLDQVAPELQRLMDLKSSNRMKQLSWKTMYNKMGNANMFGGKGTGRGRRRAE